MPLSISVVIPVYNSAKFLRLCLESLQKSTILPLECIVADDGSTDDSAEVARQFGARVVPTGGRMGPARARNIAARETSGDILFFIDADVCVYSNTLAQVLANFQEDPALDAVIGSYDESPQCPDFISQYKNLMHCFVHQHGRREACTFWSGCGAIRRAVFLEHSGFDESYGRPAIEDIELGYRLFRAKRKLMLDPSIKVKHLKAWSFWGLLKTDVCDRGIPWTELILRDRRLPNDLNLHLSQRVSVALVFLLTGMCAAGAIYAGAAFMLPLFAVLFLLLSNYEVEATSHRHRKATAGVFILFMAIVWTAHLTGRSWLIPPMALAYVLLFLRHRYLYTTERRRRITGIVCGGYLLLILGLVVAYLPGHPLVFSVFLVMSVIVLLNSQFYVFLAARRGRLFALAAVPFHLLFHFYSGLSFLIGAARFGLSRISASEKRPARAATPQ